MGKVILIATFVAMLSACANNPAGDTRHYTDYSSYTAVTSSGRHVECIDSSQGISCDWDNAR